MTSQSLNATAVQNLDDQLKATFDTGSFPAVFVGAATYGKVLYENQQGWMDMEDHSKGQVGPDTSE